MVIPPISPAVIIAIIVSSSPRIVIPVIVEVGAVIIARSPPIDPIVVIIPIVIVIPIVGSDIHSSSHHSAKRRMQSL
jgi:hypothetical protein